MSGLPTTNKVTPASRSGNPGHKQRVYCNRTGLSLLRAAGLTKQGGGVMKDENRIKGNKLAEEISNKKIHIDRARKSVVPAYYSDGTIYRFTVNNEINGIIKAITVAAMEKDLAALEAEYESL
jgi:hypothetical protein